MYIVKATVKSSSEMLVAGAGYFLFMHPSSGDDPRHVLNCKDGPTFFHLNGKGMLNLAQAKGENPSYLEKWHSGSVHCPFASC